jgi:prophage regulatory protein
VTRLLRKAEAARKTSQSLSTFDRGVRAGTFPAPIYLGPRSPRWDEAEIDAALARLKAQGADGAQRASAMTAPAREARERKIAEQRAAGEVPA